MPNTYKATSIQRTPPTVWLDVAEGLFERYKVRGGDVLVPGSTGKIEGSTFVPDELAIVLKGWIKGTSWSNYWTLVKEMRTLFDPAAGYGTLSVPLDDGTTATISARPTALIPDGDEAIGAARLWSVQLVAVDPPDWTFT